MKSLAKHLLCCTLTVIVTIISNTLPAQTTSADSNTREQVALSESSNSDSHPTERNATSKKSIYLFKIDEEIAPPASLKAQKAIDEAAAKHADIIILRLNTFGGTLDDADKIRTAILRSEVPVWAFIDNNAASAGALIAIACDSIFMRSGSSIGAATVVNQSGEVQPDKYQSYMRSMMRATAEAKGRRADMAEAMVDPDIYIAGISDSGKVLTLTTSEAIAHNYCQAEVENLNQLLQHAGIDHYILTEQRYTFIEKVVGFLVKPIVSGILIMLIICGIYFELQTPGLGFPSLLAIAAALLFFAPLYLEGLAAHWEILLFVVGVILILIELFVLPGFGVAGISGIVCIVGGLTLSLINNDGLNFHSVQTDTLLSSLATVISALIFALPLSLWLGSKLFESKLFGRLALNETQSPSQGYTVSSEDYSSVVGQIGQTLTLLRPSGKITIEDMPYDAVAQTGYIEKNTKVKVIGYENSSLIVLPINEK